MNIIIHWQVASRNSRIKEILKLVKKVAKSNASILIQGEVGTGKELIAGLIQFNSLRHKKPHIKVNCAEMSESLLECELFGRENRSFSDIHQAIIGKFEQAYGCFFHRI